MKGAFVAKRPQVELERLQLDAPFVRHVADAQGREIGLARARADAGELGTGELDLVVPARFRVGEGLQREMLQGVGEGGVQVESWQVASNVELAPQVADVRKKATPNGDSLWWQ